MLLIHSVDVSRDTKTGPIPATYVQERGTCPDACPLKGGGCYARFHNVGRVWKRLNAAVAETKFYLSWPRLCAWVKAMPKGQFWRWAIAGDLPNIGDGKTIDREKLSALVEANRGRNGFGYTHHDPKIESNAEALKEANEQGFILNWSANTLAEADEVADMAVGPVVSIVPDDSKDVVYTPKGRRAVLCPQSNPRSNVENCIGCKFLCARPDRSVIVVFPAHGTMKKKVAQMAAA